METLYFKHVKELQNEKEILEKKLGITIEITRKLVKFEGPAVNEYEAKFVLEAMQFGFSAKQAVQLLEEDIIFRKIPIKNFTRRKNLREVRARLIGKEGKTKRTIENIASCEIIINDDENSIGIICTADELDNATTAITNLIRGTKEANVYGYLERMNAEKKKYRE